MVVVRAIDIVTVTVTLFLLYLALLLANYLKIPTFRTRKTKQHLSTQVFRCSHSNDDEVVKRERNSMQPEIS